LLDNRGGASALGREEDAAARRDATARPAGARSNTEGAMRATDNDASYGPYVGDRVIAD
jgi:hypothetical protein